MVSGWQHGSDTDVDSEAPRTTNIINMASNGSTDHGSLSRRQLLDILLFRVRVIVGLGSMCVAPGCGLGLQDERLYCPSRLEPGEMDLTVA